MAQVDLLTFLIVRDLCVIPFSDTISKDILDTLFEMIVRLERTFRERQNSVGIDGRSEQD
jgi:hypothetical protein